MSEFDEHGFYRDPPDYGQNDYPPKFNELRASYFKMGFDLAWAGKERNDPGRTDPNDPEGTEYAYRLGYSHGLKLRQDYRATDSR